MNDALSELLRLVDQKNAVRFVKYNILLGNLPGSVDYFVSTGGSGGGAHATMLAATSDHPDFYDYEAAVGAVGVYKASNGEYVTTVTIDGKEVELSDGMWGCMAYSAITSLAEADIAMAFEYYLDPTYSFNTSFQKQTAEYLAAVYKDYINGKKLSVAESAAGLDINGDGDTEDTIDLTIEYDPDNHADTNGYYGTYVDFYLAEFQQSLEDYLARLDYAEDWTWFDADGEQETSGNSEGTPSGSEDSGTTEEVGTPDAGTTQSASSSTDSANYSSFSEMLEAYQTDIAEIEAGDAYGNNIVELYDPTSYIGAEGTNDPTWARVLMGASEGDISMLNSLNLDIAWLNAGTDAEIEWQWDGGHVPSEILGDSLALYVDTMYGKHVDGAVEVTKAAASGQSENGTAEEADGKDLSSWVSYDSENGVSFTAAAAAAYRTSGASKAIPGFDVMDYGQEDYEFGSSTADARHWDKYVLQVFEENESTLSELFNAN